MSFYDRLVCFVCISLSFINILACVNIKGSIFYLICQIVYVILHLSETWPVGVKNPGIK